MVDVTPPTPPPRPAASSGKRSRAMPAVNELRPSPAVVSWIDRAVHRITADPPWIYEADARASQEDARRASPFEQAPEGLKRSAASRPAVSTPRSARLDTRSVPAEVRERFTRMGRYYYFPDGNVAFEDKGRKVLTGSENTEVVRSLVAIAQARGWNDITVSGSERFRREAWRQATYAGLLVRGYEPSEQDKRQFIRDLYNARAPQQTSEPLIDPPRLVGTEVTPAPVAVAARDPAVAVPLPSQRAVGREAEADGNVRSMRSDRRNLESQRDSTRAVSNLNPEQARSDAPRGTRRGSPRSRVYAGRLLEHGEARYQFRDDRELSYFVRLETAEGPKDLWGVDFPRALGEAGVKEGDLIEVALTGRKRVAVKRPALDTNGRVLGEQEVSAHRNEWNVRAQDRRAMRVASSDRSQALHQPAAEARQSARGDPALANAWATIRAAELLAEARISDAAQRRQFVAGVRAHVAQVLDIGALPPSPPLRARAVERARTSARVLS